MGQCCLSCLIMLYYSQYCFLHYLQSPLLSSQSAGFPLLIRAVSQLFITVPVLQKALAHTQTVRLPWRRQWHDSQHTCHKNKQGKLQPLQSNSYGLYPNSHVHDVRPLLQGRAKPQVKLTISAMHTSMGRNAANCYKDTSQVIAH